MSPYETHTSTNVHVYPPPNPLPFQLFSRQELMFEEYILSHPSSLHSISWSENKKKQMKFSKIITWTSVLFFYIWNLLKSLYLINLLFFLKKLKKIECVLSEQLINSILHIVEPLIPSYARDTVSSQQRKDQGTEDRRGDTPLFLPGHIRQSTDLELFEGEEGRPHPEETPSPVWESVSFQSTIIHTAAKILYIIILSENILHMKSSIFCLQGLCFEWI